MQVSLLLALVSAVSAAKLDNLQYLPPQGNSIQPPSQQPGGNFFNAPNLIISGIFGTGQYQPPGHPQGQAPEPSGFLQQPANQYGAPDGQANQQYPQQRTPLNDVPIVRLDSENPGDGTYR